MTHARLFLLAALLLQGLASTAQAGLFDFLCCNDRSTYRPVYRASLYAPMTVAPISTGCNSCGVPSGAYYVGGGCNPCGTGSCYSGAASGGSCNSCGIGSGAYYVSGGVAGSDLCCTTGVGQGTPSRPAAGSYTPTPATTPSNPPTTGGTPNYDTTNPPSTFTHPRPVTPTTPTTPRGPRSTIIDDDDGLPTRPARPGTGTGTEGTGTGTGDAGGVDAFRPPTPVTPPTTNKPLPMPGTGTGTGTGTNPLREDDAFYRPAPRLNLDNRITWRTAGERTRLDRNPEVRDARLARRSLLPKIQNWIPANEEIKPGYDAIASK